MSFESFTYLVKKKDFSVVEPLKLQLQRVKLKKQADILTKKNYNYFLI